MATTAQQPADLHFDIQPIQVGNLIMVKIVICDNFGLTFQMVLPSQAVRGFSNQLKAGALQAETTIVKPVPSILDT